MPVLHETEPPAKTEAPEDPGEHRGFEQHGNPHAMDDQNLIEEIDAD